MKDENINDVHIVIFKHTNMINNGDIGCLNIDNNEATCKIFKHDATTSIIITSQDIGFKVIGKLALVINNCQ